MMRLWVARCEDGADDIGALANASLQLRKGANDSSWGALAPFPIVRQHVLSKLGCSVSDIQATMRAKLHALELRHAAMCLRVDSLHAVCEEQRRRIGEQLGLSNASAKSDDQLRANQLRARHHDAAQLMRGRRMERLERLADEVRDSTRKDLDMRTRIVDTLLVTDVPPAPHPESNAARGGGEVDGLAQQQQQQQQQQQVVAPIPLVPPGRLQSRQVYLDYMALWRGTPFLSNALQDSAKECIASCSEKLQEHR
jgi:hypothetical protein